MCTPAWASVVDRYFEGRTKQHEGEGVSIEFHLISCRPCREGVSRKLRAAAKQGPATIPMEREDSQARVNANE